MSSWLCIVGLSESGFDGLAPQARERLAAAETIIAPERFLKILPHTFLPDAGRVGVTLIKWQSPISAMIDQVLQQRGKSTVILATGDPNWFGIGATLKKHLSPEEFELHPAPCAFQFAAAKMYWPLQSTACISLHGRAVETLHPHILPGNHILALTSDANTLQLVSQILVGRGYGETRLTVMENLGGENQRILSFSASKAQDQVIGNFYTLAIDCIAGPGASLLSPVPGLPDEAFISDGQLTKRDVRSSTLSKLAPFPGALLWDVGAGCGAVAIEWMRSTRDTKAICFERDENRVQMITDNRVALGTPSLEIVKGTAPVSLEGQAAPDAIFIGGGVANNDLFDVCWRALKPGGRMVANAVTLEGEQALYAHHEKLGGELARIEVSVLSKVGNYRALKPRMAVTQWLIIKELDA